MIPTDADYIARIKARVSITPTGCWEWQGTRTLLGYGNTSYRNKRWAVHRLIYTLIKGPIPAKHQICHSCDNPPCCNPDHLWAGTQSQNARDALIKGLHHEAGLTHCPKGHPYKGKNLYVHEGRRDCKTCARIRQRIQAGWPKDLAEKLPAQPPGRRPVNASYVSVRNRGRKVKTHCKYGHPFSGDNLYIDPSDGRRQCRACRLNGIHRLQDQRREARKRARLTLPE